MLDILFSRICPSCGKALHNKNKLCETCLQDIRFIDDWSSCAKCGIPFGYFNSSGEYLPEPGHNSPGNLCGKCINDSYTFNKARSVAIYDGSIRELIISFKYQSKLGYADVLTDILRTYFPEDLDDFDSVVLVPLHIDKLRKREYNQSAVLAKGVAKYKGVKCDLFGLKRTRDTVPQIELKNEKERRRNVKGAFSISRSRSYENESVLLIDDVFTTGSTSDECTKMLLKSGAYKVQVLTLTRAWAM